MSKISMTKSQLKRVLKYHEMLSSNIELINKLKTIGFTDSDIERTKRKFKKIYKNGWYLTLERDFLGRYEDFYQSFK